ncbi:SDR family NAD(P)-dependent oxidoreductase [Acuticoccus kalidii]|uniref:SDR family NAD(P)-dependent oxidoreductase n=1 Tax=Acuticoccus kalidii TaxID=2910977 RepID=UPI0034E2E3CF
MIASGTDGKKVERSVAVVTGSARGIGRASACALARRGFDLALADRLEAELAETERLVRDIGADVMILTGDVSDHADVQEKGRAVIERFGRVDVLVNNAGVSQPKSLIEISEEEYDRTIAINLKSCFSWCKAVAPTMLEQKAGRIVNISSVSAHMGANANAVSKFAYVTAKAGMLGMTRALCKELAPYITVNAICPGAVRTDLTSALFDKRAEKLVETIPLGRIGTPEDIAEVVAFLATVSPNFITGEVIDVDGGQYVN